MNGFFSAHDHAGGGLTPWWGLLTTARSERAESATSAGDSFRIEAAQAASSLERQPRYCGAWPGRLSSLPVGNRKPYSSLMEVHVTPETAKKLNDLSAASGRAPEEIVEDALAGYLDHVAPVRETLDSRYDDLKSGRVKPIDGETLFETLRQREEDLLKRRRP